MATLSEIIDNVRNQLDASNQRLTKMQSELAEVQRSNLHVRGLLDFLTKMHSQSEQQQPTDIITATKPVAEAMAEFHSATDALKEVVAERTAAATKPTRRKQPAQENTAFTAEASALQVQADIEARAKVLDAFSGARGIFRHFLSPLIMPGAHGILNLQTDVFETWQEDAMVTAPSVMADYPSGVYQNSRTGAQQLYLNLGKFGLIYEDLAMVDGVPVVSQYPAINATLVRTPITELSVKDMVSLHEMANNEFIRLIKLEQPDLVIRQPERQPK